MKKLFPCCSKEADEKIDPPEISVKIDRGVAAALMRDQLRAAAHVHTADARYGLFKDSDIVRFLEANTTDQYKYHAEGFDCDDFAFVLAGRVREWYHGAKQDCGAAFGMLWGDIRKDDAPAEERPHAVNFYINEKQEIWLVEPQTDDLFKLNKYSRVDFAVM